jgi:tRNA (cmo5U34)-methyltransferase
MSPNLTPHPATEYARAVQRVVPFHAIFHEQAIEVALAAVPRPRAWLDTGCGPGKLARSVRAKSPETELWLADPSDEMLAVARETNPELPAERFILEPTERIGAVGPLDVVTALLCHHYGDEAARARAIGRSRELLVPGGVYVTFENVRADTDEGHALQRRRWAAWQLAQGRTEAQISEHFAREDRVFFPIRVETVTRLLRDAGFRTVELVWRSYGQAGWAAIA